MGCVTPTQRPGLLLMSRRGGTESSGSLVLGWAWGMLLLQKEGRRGAHLSVLPVTVTSLWWADEQAEGHKGALGAPWFATFLFVHGVFLCLLTRLKARREIWLWPGLLDIQACPCLTQPKPGNLADSKV